MKSKQMIYAAVVGMCAFGWTHAAEFGAATPYYEKDGWLDISEWFDGNDYNPTDETWWRWDDETYEFAEDTGTDVDSKSARDNWYGFADRDDNDWFYDYYNPYPYSYYDSDDNDLYEHGVAYYDYDDDGLYDAYATYSDWDDDGLYEDYDYYSFTDTGTDEQRQRAQGQVAKESRQQKVTGKIQKTKLVQVRENKKHVVVAIQPQGKQAKTVVADLGSADDLKEINPKLGDQITVVGPKANVGKQSIVLANSLELNGKKTKIDRNPRSMTGEVVSTHKSAVRGQQHLMAMVETSHEGKPRKVAVDLGPADRLKTEIKKGTSLTFSGFPMKVEGKLMMMAQTIYQGDKVVQINRRPKAADRAG